ncbi:MAG: TSUP family transporter [Woeseia sp.]
MDLSLSSWGLLAPALLAIGIGGIAKGMTGVGLPILAVPVLASFTSVEEAVVLMVLPGIAANGWLVVTHRKWAVLRQHSGFLLLGLTGGVFGTWLLSILGDRWLKLTLAIWLGVYLVQYFSVRSYDRYFSGRGGLGPILGMAAGTIQGASGISAPIVAPYFHANGLVREAYAFATASTFLLFAGAQIAAMSKMDLLTAERLMVGLIIVVPTLLFTYLGIRLAHRITEQTFHRILLALFVAMEIKLVRDIL